MLLLLRLLLLLLLLTCEVSIFLHQVEAVNLKVILHGIINLPELGKQVLVDSHRLVTGKVIIVLLHLLKLGSQGSCGWV